MRDLGTIHQQIKVAQFIRNLQEELKVLQKYYRAAGLSQGSTFIEVENSDFDSQDKMKVKESKGKQNTLKYYVLKDMLELLISFKNLRGFYYIPEMQEALERKLQLAEGNNEFEISQIILKYRNMLSKELSSSK